MNTGIISSRYARALLDFSLERGDAESVCRQAEKLENAIKAVPELRRAMNEKVSFSYSDKLSLLKTALGDEKMASSLESFLLLVMKKGRLEYLVLILRSFIDAYYKAKNILFADLVTAVPIEGLDSTLAEMVGKSTGKTVIVNTKVDPTIVGGFIFTVNDVRLDASVSRQIDIMKKQFLYNNRRIV